MMHNQFNLEIFRKDYGFLSYTKNLGKNSSKNIGKNLGGKCSQKLLGHAKQSATDAFKTWFKINDDARGTYNTNTYNFNVKVKFMWL